ncbi:MAG TPA: hypothetical protein VGP46_02590 [Acidimicrobiales bacterium]|jgi:hypothetical protein|nr:hypothetical protein [Acidimicrobiales bacterium]
MSDGRRATSTSTLEELADRLAKLEAQARSREAQLVNENLRLSRRLQELAGSGEVPAPRSDTSPPAAISRRGTFKMLGAAAAGGVGLALGSTVLAAEPAQAATGTMKYGETNNAVSAQTQLTGTVENVAALNVINGETSHPGAGLCAMSYAPSGLPNVIGAILADTNGKAGPAVVGMSSGGNGVYGVYNGTSHITAGTLAGVVGDTDEAAAGGGRGTAPLCEPRPRRDRPQLCCARQ